MFEILQPRGLWMVPYHLYQTSPVALTSDHYRPPRNTSLLSDGDQHVECKTARTAHDPPGPPRIAPNTTSDEVSTRGRKRVLSGHCDCESVAQSTSNLRGPSERERTRRERERGTQTHTLTHTYAPKTDRGLTRILLHFTSQQHRSAPKTTTTTNEETHDRRRVQQRFAGEPKSAAVRCCAKEGRIQTAIDSLSILNKAPS